MKNLFYVFGVSFSKTQLANKIIVFLVLLFLLLPQFACNTTEPPDIKPPAEPDSTTQNFTFETFEFGDGFSSSYLNDVWIFNENNIWAVGYISPTDTIINGNHITNPNIIKWNGKDWKIQIYSGTSSGMYGIWAADSNHLYIADGGVVKYDYVTGFKSEDFSKLGFVNYQTVKKLWGSSTSNVWGVGTSGIIVHYDGSKWSKIDFDQGYRFDAITGSKQTGIAYASATSQQFNTIIVELKDNTASIIYNSATDPNNLTSFSIKLLNAQELILAREYVWTFNINTKDTKILYSLPPSSYAARSDLVSPIDIYFFVKPYEPGENLLHYNGKRYALINFSNRNSVIYGGSYAIKDLAVMTGFSNNKGYLVKVKRVK